VGVRQGHACIVALRKCLHERDEKMLVYRLAAVCVEFIFCAILSPRCLTEIFTHVGLELAASRVSHAQASHCATIARQLFANLSPAQQGIVTKMSIEHRQRQHAETEWPAAVPVRFD